MGHYYGFPIWQITDDIRKTKVPKKPSVDEKTGKNSLIRDICEFGVTMKLLVYLKVSSIEYFPKKTI